MLAALRPQMLRLAGREADGAILNWLASYDVAQCLTAVENPDADVVARIFVCPTDDAGYARMLGKTLISTYLTVPAYAAFHDWLGRGDALRPMHDAWAAGDRKGAAAAVPDDVVGRPRRPRRPGALSRAGARVPAGRRAHAGHRDAADAGNGSTPQGIYDAVRRMGAA